MHDAPARLAAAPVAVLAAALTSAIVIGLAPSGATTLALSVLSLISTPFSRTP